MFLFPPLIVIVRTSVGLDNSSWVQMQIYMVKKRGLHFVDQIVDRPIKY
jgi:hypothetical protein